ncbi:ABC transporter substrate-binding protein [Aurantimonas sp. C2-6-R+9]|uniref:ABC transporter substrate-binding protein n=1 Tax=unclassified Aurantimonas TaxID=2638230 RepID=UPI002E16C740|nr:MULTISPECIES: ABC transporter substrate-binding protein [unclassified Aurantimonas]MEC5291535.1 ABC transporter substrate-binding protein [Aurantimonas sp. C2-3-R2]MEC5381683.1 ABC transporter substrate-binding protein [Aurantimonas sp. C2-6-R+9]MEC5412621.1 ABC transporter substrate-binding protein [Aurantimonas sp. C2-4-R8]
MSTTNLPRAAAAALGSLILLASAGAQARDLTVVSWGGSYQDAQKKIYFEPFSQKIGKPVLDESWDGGIGVIAAKTQAGVPNWDVVQVESEELELGCFDGMYEPIDWEALGGRDKFIDAAVSDCGVGAIVWSTAISYDASKLTTAPTSWADFWDVEKIPGKRGLRRGPKYSLEFALMADGVAPAEVYSVLATPEGVDRAFAKLDALKPNIVWWESGAQPLQLLASGEVAMTTAYNGRISGINKDEGTNFEVVWNGSIYAVDSWVILKDSPNAEEAMDFIAFASAPENQSKLPEYIAYGLPNKEAAAQVPADLQADLPTTAQNIENAVPLDAGFWTDNVETLTKRFDAWLAQ